MNYTFSPLSVKKIVLAVLLGAFFLACVEKDKPEPVPEPVPQILTATFDQTEYFPFDAITIMLSEKATGQEYNGTLGYTPVTAVRMDDSTLVMLTPDLPTGDYTLTIPFSDKPNEKKVEGRLRIKPLPTVENPDAVIEEITDTYHDRLLSCPYPESHKEDYKTETYGFGEYSLWMYLINDSTLSIHDERIYTKTSGN